MTYWTYGASYWTYMTSWSYLLSVLSPTSYRANVPSFPSHDYP